MKKLNLVTLLGCLFLTFGSLQGCGEKMVSPNNNSGGGFGSPSECLTYALADYSQCIAELPGEPTCDPGDCIDLFCMDFAECQIINPDNDYKVEYNACMANFGCLFPDSLDKMKI